MARNDDNQQLGLDKTKEELEMESQVKSFNNLNSSQTSNSSSEMTYSPSSSLYHTPEEKKRQVATNFVFGPKSKNSTQMALFFMKGPFSYALSPANYSKIKRRTLQAQDIGQSGLNISLVSGDLIQGSTNNEFVWKYAKVAFEISEEKSKKKPDDDIDGIKSKDRILLCQEIRRAESYNNYKIIDSFAIYVPLKLFLEAGQYLYVENENGNSFTDIDF